MKTAATATTTGTAMVTTTATAMTMAVTMAVVGGTAAWGVIEMIGEEGTTTVTVTASEVWGKGVIWV